MRKPFASTLTRAFAGAFMAWVLLTLLGLVLLVAVYAARGGRGIEILLPRGAWTYSPLILLSAAVAWVLAGCALLIAWRQPPRRAALPFFIGFFLLAFLYLNLLRERERFYDLNDYLVAARALSDGQPLPPRYLYPPLLAVSLAPLLPMGEPALLALFTAANFAALLLFYFLLWRTLQRGGFSSESAALASLALLAVNVPLQRTLFYGQVNLIVAGLILTTLLAAGRRPALSALALALAAHLKIIPAVFILPFLIRRDGRWLGWCAVFIVAIGSATLVAGGATVYHDFLANARAALASPPETNFRDNSLDSFLRATAYVLRHLAHVSIPPAALTVIIYLAKALLLGGGIYLLAARAPSSAPAALQQESKTENEKELAPAGYYDAFMIASFLMVLLSPVAWEHYPVFLIFPFLALLPADLSCMERPEMLSTPRYPGRLVAWLAAGCLMFWVPTFDFYPFSFTRLAGIMLCLPLLVHRQPGKKII